MNYIKTYCYAEHELEFIKAQLVQSEGHIDFVVVYEYDVTHRGDPKPYRLEHLIPTLDANLRKRLIYRPVSIKHLCKKTHDAKIIHAVNEQVQRSYFFNDPEFNLQPSDMIIDCDVDEIIYERCYRELFNFQRLFRIPVGLKMNQFFYKPTYLWTDANFSGPTCYRFSSVRRPRQFINNDFKICHRRSLRVRYPRVCGAHMSWIMPIPAMITKLKSYSHPEYERFADEVVLAKAISDKKYIFDDQRAFTIQELEPGDYRIVL